jgi:hypothetical protein
VSSLRVHPCRLITLFVVFTMKQNGKMEVENFRHGSQLPRGLLAEKQVAPETGS